MSDRPVLPRDPNGVPGLAATDETTKEIIKVLGDEASGGLRILNLVWNTSELAWERMTQPTLSADSINVNLDTIEQYLLDQLAQYQLSDWLESGDYVYLGFLDKSGKWYIKKIDTSSGTVRFIKGDSDYDFSDSVSLSYDTFSETF